MKIGGVSTLPFFCSEVQLDDSAVRCSHLVPQRMTEMGVVLLAEQKLQSGLQEKKFKINLVKRNKCYTFVLLNQLKNTICQKEF